MGELSSLPNIGEAVAQQLESAGIRTAEQLRQIGSKDAWLKIQQADPSACLNRLYALEGAVRGVKKSELPPEVKAGLKEFYEMHKL
ncbi:MAG: TfoX/Sxy family protein [Clostridia bacterium]